MKKEMHSGPGEMDMLLGFFIMNGACIIFFLTFGLCVICSCMRKKPKFIANDEPSQTAPLSKAPPVTTTITPNSTFKSKINKLRPKSTKQTSSSNGPAKPAFIAPPPITSPMLKPTFKAIVARAMEQQKLAQKQLATANSVEKGNNLSVNNSRANSRRGSGSSTNKGDVNQKLLGDTVENSFKIDTTRISNNTGYHHHPYPITTTINELSNSPTMSNDIRQDEVIIFL